MLSKILSGAAGSAAERHAWPTTDGPRRPDPAAAGPSPEEAAYEARRAAEIEQRVERARREARQAGHAEGQAAGRAQAAAELQPVFEKLARTIQEVAGLRPRILRETEGELVELSLAIARRILRRELSVDPDALRGLVKSALEKLPAQEISRIRIHPELLPGVQKALAGEGRELPLMADGTLAPGALLIETARGKLDGSIETQLAEIGRGLADRFAEQ
ncbi:MAG TPA: FliH/SctL family protein [Bryobacteraceae bacterium]|nr:FliH/SctL family protein [Bryobacteraceae bacterium]